jgi:hypothetical protein
MYSVSEVGNMHGQEKLKELRCLDDEQTEISTQTSIPLLIKISCSHGGKYKHESLLGQCAVSSHRRCKDVYVSINRIMSHNHLILSVLDVADRLSLYKSLLWYFYAVVLLL